MAPPPPAGGPGAPEVPDWAQANPAAIERSLAVALARPTGGWFVLGSRRELARGPRRYVVAGRHLVAWRAADGALLVGSDLCPHLGGPLHTGRVCAGELVCPWHGLHLGPGGHGAWRPLPAHDDGVLTWVRLDDELTDGERPTESPALPTRPERGIAAVVRVEADCEPADVLANRLDPWHGRWFHPYSFAGLVVREAVGDRLDLDVTYRIGPVRFPVHVEFTCPDARTIAMRILDGEGAGSVAETHAVPLGPGRTAIVEAAIATSDRPGFRNVLKVPGPLRGFLGWASKRLWTDDAAYAARRYAVRTGRVR